MLLYTLHRLIWGLPALVWILGTGIFLTVRLNAVQLRLFPPAVRQVFIHHSAGTVTPFQALCTALGGTVGTGNLVGVAGAICLGGPGAVFWMIISAFLGMAVKFAEATLSVRFRIFDDGKNRCGPMYMISQGLGKRWDFLAGIYALLGIFACFGIGNMVQIRAILSAAECCVVYLGHQYYASYSLFIGIVLAMLAGWIFSGSNNKLLSTLERLVPVASGSYLLICILVLFIRHEWVLPALREILTGAFYPKAVTGGLVGSFASGLIHGCSRGIFSNEAGLGTASVAHGAAEVKHPVEQGMMGILEVFLDTCVICFMTGLAILVSGVSVSYGSDAGLSLTNAAFSLVIGNWATVVISACLSLLAFATVLSWGLYGGAFSFFLGGKRGERIFYKLHLAVIPFAAIIKTSAVWQISEIFNGLLMIPNLIALIVLSPKLNELLKEYKEQIYQRR